MYRLMNVSVNPAGKFGAPETEPGPSGVDSAAEDKLMTIPPHRTSQAAHDLEGFPPGKVGHRHGAVRKSVTSCPPVPDLAEGEGVGLDARVEER
jgi:hypothetical protein